ncbi:hypothetical protein LZ32DRAFT_611672 [Colletotrichum eremochloae]|nr:hypothetical protein LZ32DRAFT_611672 [Colletotrichum eremochloae]
MDRPRYYRAIRPASNVNLPAVVTLRQSHGSRSLSSLENSSQLSRRSTANQKCVRRKIQVACEHCRQHKTKCPAERPKCSSCAYKGIDCRYEAGPSESRMASVRRQLEEARRQNEHFKEFFRAVLSMSEVQLHNILGRVRAGMSIEDILRQIKDGRLLLQIRGRSDTVEVSGEEAAR